LRESGRQTDCTVDVNQTMFRVVMAACEVALMRDRAPRAPLGIEENRAWRSHGRCNARAEDGVPRWLDLTFAGRAIIDRS
jgi:hypothetical protein